MEVSAPGKILWIGGYSVLERPNVSFVTGVDKRVFATIEKSDGVSLISKQFGYELEGTIGANGEITLTGEDGGAKFVKAACQSSCAYLAHKGKPVSGFELKTVSDGAFGVEVKAGLGSSAAVTVASVGAVLALHGYGVETNRELVHKLSQYSHYVAQGKVGSGFDIAAAAVGASSYVRYSPAFVTEHPFPASIGEEWDFEVRHVPVPPQFCVAAASLGKSASTSEMVKKVNAWKAAQPEAYARLMAEYNGANIRTIAALEKLSSDFNRFNLEDFRAWFGQGRLQKKTLGEKSGTDIESDGYTALIEESEKNGAFVACLPGAGGGDSIAAFCLGKKKKEELKAFWAGYGLKVLDVGISNDGVRMEPL